MQETKLVFTPKLAKKLLKKGYQIVDLKPNRDNSERTIFVFRNDAGLIEDIKNLAD